MTRRIEICDPWREDPLCGCERGVCPIPRSAYQQPRQLHRQAGQRGTVVRRASGGAGSGDLLRHCSQWGTSVKAWRLAPQGGEQSGFVRRSHLPFSVCCSSLFSHTGDMESWMGVAFTVTSQMGVDFTVVCWVGVDLYSHLSWGRPLQSFVELGWTFTVTWVGVDLYSCLLSWGGPLQLFVELEWTFTVTCWGGVDFYSCLLRWGGPLQSFVELGWIFTVVCWVGVDLYSRLLIWGGSLQSFVELGWIFTVICWGGVDLYSRLLSWGGPLLSFVELGWTFTVVCLSWGGPLLSPVELGWTFTVNCWVGVVLYSHLVSWGGPLQSLGGCCHKCVVITRSRRSVVRLEWSNGFGVGERGVGRRGGEVKLSMWQQEIQTMETLE